MSELHLSEKYTIVERNKAARFRAKKNLPPRIFPMRRKRLLEVDELLLLIPIPLSYLSFA